MSMGMTAGSGIDGAGDGDRRDDDSDDRWLWLRWLNGVLLGGFIGKAMDVGVPGAEGAGEAAAAADEATEDSDATLLAADNRARFTARVEGRRRFTSGEAIEFAVPPDAVHLFDAGTGEALR